MLRCCGTILGDLEEDLGFVACPFEGGLGIHVDDGVGEGDKSLMEVLENYALNTSLVFLYTPGQTSGCKVASANRAPYEAL